MVFSMRGFELSNPFTMKVLRTIKTFLSLPQCLNSYSASNLRHPKGEKEMKPNWINQRNAEQQKQPQTKLYLFQEGETVVEIDITNPPRDHDFGNGKRAIYTAKINGKVVEFAASKTLDRLIIKALMNDVNPMTLIRTGTELDTEYSVKELNTA